MTSITAIIELVVGAVSVAFAWPCWRRRDVAFRVLASCLALAGGIAIANAIRTLLR